jgi:hypothetical protein
MEYLQFQNGFKGAGRCSRCYGFSKAAMVNKVNENNRTMPITTTFSLP